MDAVSNLDLKLTEADVDALFEVMLGRPCDSPTWRKELADSPLSVREYLVMLRGCRELRDRIGDEKAREAGLAPRDPAYLRDPTYHRVPIDLAVTQIAPRRVLIVGSCLMDFWSSTIAAAHPAGPNDLFLLGSELPDLPPHPMAEYDFQVVQLPLRAVLPDGVFARLKQSDTAGHEALLRQCAAHIGFLLETAMRWNKSHGILTFVIPFIVPEQNPIGRLLPRYDLRNPVFFIERLNEALGSHLGAYTNAYMLDFNEVLASHGRRYAQEDAIAQFNHGALLSDFDFHHDGNRIEPSRAPTALIEQRASATVIAGWQEMLAAWRTVRQTDMVKMVVVDLDDTLWRGTIAELDLDNIPTAEGWPRAFWEALNILKRRGVLLAIVSNNDDARIVAAFDRVLCGIMKLDDFAARRIDWRPKSEKMREVLESVNLLPRNVVFIDDNPLQRAEVKSAFPEIRVLGGEPFLWRQILLWAPETQLPHITAESDARTEMVQAQQQRETQRATLNRRDFLTSLNVRMSLFIIDGPGHPRFTRVLELINKTNQFNTTGERWTQAEMEAAIGAGMEIHAFDLADIHTEYGLVGVILLECNIVRQFVMSCRILGLEAEIAAVARMVAVVRARGHHRIGARVIETDRNLPCRNLYERCDFRLQKSVWLRETDPPPPIAQHIELTAPPLS